MQPHATVTSRSVWNNVRLRLGKAEANPLRTPKPVQPMTDAGRRATRTRRVVLHFARAGRWTGLLLQAITRLRALPGTAR